MHNFFKLTIGIIFAAIVLTGCLKKLEPTSGLTDPNKGILFVSDRDNNWEIYVVQPDKTRLTRLTDHPSVDSDPSWFPDGIWIAFRSRREGSSDIFQMKVDGTELMNLVKDEVDSYFDEFSPKMNPGGEFFALYSDRFQVIGNCRAGVHHLAFMPRSGQANKIENFTLLTGEQTSMSWSPDGRYLAFSSVCNESQTQIYVLDTEEQEVYRLTDIRYYAGFPDWSPDGKKLAYVSNQPGNLDIFILNFDSGETYNLTNHPARDTEPSWSPDGTRIAFMTDRDNNEEIYRINVDGSDQLNLTNNPSSDFLPDWSPIQ